MRNVRPYRISSASALAAALGLALALGAFSPGVQAVAGTRLKPLAQQETSSGKAGTELASFHTSEPASVTIAGSLQSELGCPGDWQPECTSTMLTPEDGVWQSTWTVPAGNWEYKAALNGGWSENYGANAQPNGANINLSLSAPTAVKFYYDHETHWVTSNRNALIVTAPGDWQSEAGCGGDWDPTCLRSWLKDPDGDGIYTMTVTSLPAGNYETKITIDESWSENYGQGGARDGANIAFTVPAACTPIFFSFNSATKVLTVSAEGAPKGDLSTAKAHWVSTDTIAWNPLGFESSSTVALHAAATGGLGRETSGVTGGDVLIPLTRDPAGLSDEIKTKFPHLSGLLAFKLPADRLHEVPEALEGQVAVSVVTNGVLADATSLQIPGVLDDLYDYDGALGPVFASGAPTLRVWAPTAKSVSVALFDDANPATTPTLVPMTEDATTGVWSATGSAGWKGRYYLYDVEVYVPSTGQVEHNLVTDPYSLSLSTDGMRSQIVDLADPATKPAGWDGLVKPALEAPEDIVVYELHIRDFSATDETVPEPLRGTYRAFALAGTDGMSHLSALSAAGLTHVHLLPAFDIASVGEDRSAWQEPAGDLASYPPDSDQQQAAVWAVRDQDGFNWGYDPVHYTVPDGSYATNPDGVTRIVEFREMVKGLSDVGLRTIMDVVYNHTSSSGQNENSVLDKIVPGYYHRLNGEGAIERSTCCENTASEHEMMEKLLVDSVVTWAKQYKVDGFRFDLMGHHMKRNMVKLRQALDALTLETDGVDGSKIYLYGEGWNFGEVANNARGVNAVQANMAGTGIGTFSDRLRDAVRGGGPFSGIQEQGFLTGLSYDPNATNQGSPDDQRNRLLLLSDWLRVGLAGHVATFTFEDRNGNTVAASQVDYNGQAAGYTADPQESINYIEAHDNETLFDAIQLKAPLSMSMADRVRTQNLGLSILTLGEGIPFVHAGADMLRSKSLDRNSYNSGDWFNALDFTYNTNNWGVGLPPAQDNQSHWPLFAPLLANPALAPQRADILNAVSHFQEMLAVRKSSRLFRLRTAADINTRLRFLNTGPNQAPGLVVMTLSDDDGSIDPARKAIVVLLNANDEAQSFAAPGLAGRSLSLHPILAVSHDPVVRGASFTSGTGTFMVPGRTAAVFVQLRPAAARIQLLTGEIDELVAAGALNAGQGASLLTKLQAAAGSLEKGKQKTAINQLQAFVLELRDLVATGVLTSVQAQPLIAEAEGIIAQLR